MLRPKVAEYQLKLQNGGMLFLFWAFIPGTAYMMKVKKNKYVKIILLSMFKKKINKSFKLGSL